jgi:hypothetical protein
MGLFDRPQGPAAPAASSTTQPALNTQAAATVGPLPAQLVLNSSAEAIVANPLNAAIALTVALPPNTQNEQSELILAASGYIKTTSTTNITAKVYSGTSLTPGSNTSIATSGTVAQNSANAPFMLRVHLVYDSVSGKLGGFFKFLINNTLVAEGALSNVVTALTNTGNPVATFCLSFTSSGADGTHLTTINVARFSVG